MGGLFGGRKPKMPAPPPPPAPPPTVDEAAQATQQADALRRRRGRSANILTSPLGAAPPTVGAKRLLGD